jgi:hypothetical protein
VLTVCDILRNIVTRRGKEVVIVALSGFTFEGTFLGEQCDSDAHVMIEGHKWLGMIAVNWGDAAPETAAFPIEDAILRRKQRDLSQAEGTHTPTTANDASVPPSPRNAGITLRPHWIAVYGRMESPNRPEPPRISGSTRSSGNGYRANGSVPAQIRVKAYRSLEPPQQQPRHSQLCNKSITSR